MLSDYQYPNTYRQALYFGSDSMVDLLLLHYQSQLMEVHHL
jgi:hypothetical protein